MHVDALFAVPRNSCRIQVLSGDLIFWSKVLSGQDCPSGPLHQDGWKSIHAELMGVLERRIGVPAPKSWVVQSLRDLDILMLGAPSFLRCFSKMA